MSGGRFLVPSTHAMNRASATWHILRSFSLMAARNSFFILGFIRIFRDARLRFIKFMANRMSEVVNKTLDNVY